MHPVRYIVCVEAEGVHRGKNTVVLFGELTESELAALHAQLKGGALQHIFLAEKYTHWEQARTLFESTNATLTIAVENEKDIRTVRALDWTNDARCNVMLRVWNIDVALLRERDEVSVGRPYSLDRKSVV